MKKTKKTKQPEVIDHLGRPVTAYEMQEQLAAMLGWLNTAPYDTLMKDLRMRLRMLQEFQTNHKNIACGLK